MILSGLLATTTPPSIGTVVLVDPSNQTIVAVASAALNGRFDLSCPALPTNGLVHGFPGAVLDVAQATAALRSYAGVSYIAEVPAAPDVDGDYYVYVNAASSCVHALRAANPALTADQASTEIKRRLFGPGVATFMPGYSAEFLAQVVAPDVFSPQVFAAAVARAGGLAQWLGQGIATGPTAPRKRPFAALDSRRQTAAARRTGPLATGTAPETNVAAAAPSNEPIPTIPNSANWASNDPFWTNTLDAENDFSDTASTLSETTDGIAASVGESAISMSAAEIAQWATKALAAGVVSAIGTQLFTLFSTWVFGAKMNPVLSALEAISRQLSTVISNQVKILNDLAQIEAQLNAIGQNSILLALTPSVTVIQFTYRRVHKHSTSGKGVPSATIGSLANSILNSTTGVSYAKLNIHNLITGASNSTSLPVATYSCVTSLLGPTLLKQNFLTNENCYLAAQGLFHYYAQVQAQATQLEIQAHNYNTNVGVTDPAAALAVNPNATASYNNTLIGGAGGSLGAPMLEQQRDLYRATFWPVCEPIQGYMGLLPDDIAVCLLPSVPNRTAPACYDLSTKLIVLMHISGALRNWTANADVLAHNPVSWTVPARLAWRYPGLAEFRTMLAAASASPNYSSNQFQYLLDQGFSSDIDNYPAGYAFNWLFTRDYGNDSEIWHGEMEGDSSVNHPSLPTHPKDITRTKVEPFWYQNLFFSHHWHYKFTGNFPWGFATDGNLAPFSSEGLNVFMPTDSSSQFAEYPWLRIRGGIVVADLQGYIPVGPYTTSCKDIKITLTCQAPTPQGTTVSLSFDLTPYSDITLNYAQGALSLGSQYVQRTTFTPTGQYTDQCTKIKVVLTCLAYNGTDWVPASFDLTSSTISGLTLTNVNGTLTG